MATIVEQRSADTLRPALAHVLWIGGAPDAGKTAVATALSAAHGLQRYHYDQYDRQGQGHWARADPARQPRMYASLTSGKSLDDRWVHATPDELLARFLGTSAERFWLVVEDLLALPPAPPVVAEGFGLLPEWVHPLLTTPRQAVWLVPTPTFKQASMARRQKLRETSDPERARRNLFERDLRIADHVRARAESRGLGSSVIEVDGVRPLQEVIAEVAARFAPLLPSGGPAPDRQRP